MPGVNGLPKKDYVAWAKQRAVDELDGPGDPMDRIRRATASIVGDLMANPETAAAINPATLMLLTATAESGDIRRVRHEIDGFQ